MKIDGIELLKKYRDGEIGYNTKIKSISASGNIYYMHIGLGQDKILYDNGEPVSTGYLTNKNNEFEIIEEFEDLEEIETIVGGDCKHRIVESNGTDYEVSPKLKKTINKLIKNQKKIIEILKSDKNE